MVLPRRCVCSLVCFAAAGLLALTVSGCGLSNDGVTITLATTTSTRDSGLLDELVPVFEKQTGIKVKVVAVGSGQAIELGKRGDADVLLTHAPNAEEQFMSEGHGADRRAVMFNDFVLVGPVDDPADVGKQTSIVDSLMAIADQEAAFVSRGDNSGTYMKEQQLWTSAELEPSGDWYIRSGSGMAAALRVASEKQAYVLTDRGTYLAQRDNLDLIIVGEGDTLLHNPYSVIVVSSDKHDTAVHEAATKWADFLVSPETQARIAKFGMEKFGQPLFFARKTASE